MSYREMTDAEYAEFCDEFLESLLDWPTPGARDHPDTTTRHAHTRG